MDLIWTKLRDHYSASGDLGNYRIIEKKTSDGEGLFLVAVRKNKSAPKSLGNFSTLANAQSAATAYENYRNEVREFKR